MWYLLQTGEEFKEDVQWQNRVMINHNIKSFGEGRERVGYLEGNRVSIGFHRNSYLDWFYFINYLKG